MRKDVIFDSTELYLVLRNDCLPTIDYNNQDECDSVLLNSDDDEHQERNNNIMVKYYGF